MFNKDSFAIILMYASFFALVLGILCAANFISCHVKSSKQDLECSYIPLQGCMVKIDGKWIDYDRLRLIEQ